MMYESRSIKFLIKTAAIICASLYAVSAIAYPSPTASNDNGHGETFENPFDYCQFIGNTDDTDQYNVPERPGYISTPVGEAYVVRAFVRNLIMTNNHEDPQERINELNEQGIDITSSGLITPELADKINPLVGVGVGWRCMDGKVYACHPGANIDCYAKANTSRIPNREMYEYCRENPDSSYINYHIVGKDNVYGWACEQGIPAIQEQFTDIDAQGYLAVHWTELEQ